MSDMKKSDANRGGRGPQGSGSNTVSAAKISAGTSVGTAGNPSGPEHTRHLDRDADKAGAGHSAADAARQMAAQTTGTVRETVSEVQERAGEVLGQAAEWTRGTVERATSAASDAYEQGARYYDQASRRSLEHMGTARRSVERFVAENPVMVGVIGFGAGLLIGALLPRTRQEDRTFGRWADEVREQGVRYARDLTQRGRELVEHAFEDEGSAQEAGQRLGSGQQTSGQQTSGQQTSGQQTSGQQGAGRQAPGQGSSAQGTSSHQGGGQQGTAGTQGTSAQGRPPSH